MRLFVILIFVELVFLIAVIFFKPVYAIAFIIGVGCIIYLLWGSDQLPKSILLTILISSILLETKRRFHIRIEELPIIFVIGFALLNRLLGYKSNAEIGPIGKWLSAFLIVVGLGGVLGFMGGRKLYEVGNELAIYLYYSIFFFVIESDMDEQWIKYIVYGVIGITIVVTFEYLWIVYTTEGTQRAVTDQQHFLNIGIPLVFSWLLYEKRGWIKLLLAFLLIPMGVAVLVTLTRMIWVIVPISTLLVLLIYLRDRRALFRHYLYTMASVGIVLIFLLFPVKEVLTRQIGLYEALKGRITSLTRLSTDLSLLARLELASYAWPRIKKKPILGTGLGDNVAYRFILAGVRVVYRSVHGGSPFYTEIPFPRVVIHWMDMSYLNVLWKLGIVGLVLFIGLYYVFIKRTIFVFKHASNDFIKWSTLGILVGFLSLIGIGVLSAILVGYRFNFTWATLMGIIELQAQRIAKTGIKP